MLRHALALMLVLVAASNLCAQEWANKMFETMSHDFGSVARGVKAQYRFKFKNPYREDLHVASVRSTCNCTTPTISKTDLKTFEDGEVIADLNTRDFTGFREATITVKFDKPMAAEVQLNIRALIRSDVVLTPSKVDFGTVDAGSKSEIRIRVDYAGRESWKLEDARTADPHFEVEMSEVARGGGKVTYDLLVRLTKDAPVGYIKDQLILVTNDAKASDLPVEMTGQVMSAIKISPSPLFIGSVQVGQKVTKTLIVSGKTPFKIVDVKCNDDSFSVTPSNRAATIHRVPIEFTATEAGRVTRRIIIKTDQGPEATASFVAHVDVVKAGVNHVARASRTTPLPSDDKNDEDDK